MGVVKILQTSRRDRYFEIKKLFGEKSNDDTSHDEQVLVEATEPYKMETIDIDRDIEKGIINE